MPWKFQRVRIPDKPSDIETSSIKLETTLIQDTLETDVEADTQPAGIHEQSLTISLPWAAFGALLLALFAQNSLEPGPGRNWLPGLIFYMMALACLFLAIYRSEWSLTAIPNEREEFGRINLQITELIIGLFLAMFVFLISTGNRFTIASILLLILSVVLVTHSFWVRTPGSRTASENIRRRLANLEWNIHLTPGALLGIGLFLMVLFFRFYHLGETPAEMNSDHAEKIMDISRLIQGQSLIFFPNNGGREAMQMYLTAGLSRLFGLDLNFYLLKLSSSLVGFLALIFIYLLGKEIANQRVGLLAFAFCGVAYWSNVVSRMGLRLPFYILFTASTLYFLIRGLKNKNQNDLLLAGISLGLSFYGYTADRVLALLVVVVIGIYLLHKNSRNFRYEVLLASLGLIIISLILFLPLFRYALEYPQAFFYRSLSRVGPIEQNFAGPPVWIFFSNLWRALTMMFWSDGEVWTLSVPFRPALDVVTGAGYWIGLVLILVRTIRKRHWVDISLLASIPILLLPSVMAIAFPAENPNLYRTGGVLVPVFLIVALAFDGLMVSLEERIPKALGKVTAWSVVLLLLLGSSLLSYNLVFEQYDAQYRLSAWNSSEMGKVIREFSSLTGSSENAWVIGYPYWVDTRLVAMQAGLPERDLAITLDQLPGTTQDSHAKLFLIKPEDETALASLRTLYPQGTLSQFQSIVPTKEFMIFFVPSQP